MRNCPICDINNNHVKVNICIDSWELVNCKNCAFLYLRNPPPYEALSEKFAWEKTFEIEKLRRNKKRPISFNVSKYTRFRLRLIPRNDVNNLVRNYVKIGNILDLGCADGSKLLKLEIDKYTPFGIEISKSLAAQANKNFQIRGGYCLHKDALSGLQEFPNNFFSSIIMRSYLEHEINPKDILLRANRVLDKDGILIIKVPNYNSWNRYIMGNKWCGYRFPDHVNYFTPASLKNFVKSTGFRILKFNLMDYLPTSDNMWMIATK